MEDEIIKALENATGLRIFPNTAKLVMIKLGLVMKKEQFMKFREWLISNGFKEMEVNENSIASLFLDEVSYKIWYSDKKHKVKYRHVDGKKEVYLVYTVDDTVILGGIVYVEQS